MYKSMEQKLRKVFKNAQYYPESSLSEKIFVTIVAKDMRIVRIKMWIYSSLSILSFGALFPSIKMLMADFTQSGFYEYLSFAFSDGGTLVSYWKEFALSLIDSLPVVSVVLCLALIFAFLFSIRNAFGHIRNQLAFNAT